MVCKHVLRSSPYIFGDFISGIENTRPHERLSGSYSLKCVRYAKVCVTSLCLLGFLSTNRSCVVLTLCGSLCIICIITDTSVVLKMVPKPPNDLCRKGTYSFCSTIKTATLTWKLATRNAPRYWGILAYT